MGIHFNHKSKAGDRKMQKELKLKMKADDRKKKREEQETVTCKLGGMLDVGNKHPSHSLSNTSEGN